MVNRKVKVFGHGMRKEEMENLVTTGYIEARELGAAKGETYLTYLQKMKEKTPIELIRLKRDSGVWSELSNSSIRQHDMTPWKGKVSCSEEDGMSTSPTYRQLPFFFSFVCLAASA